MREKTLKFDENFRNFLYGKWKKGLVPKKPEIPERMKVPEKELYSRAEQNKPQKRFQCSRFADCVILKDVHPLLLAHYSACLLRRPLSHWGGPSSFKWPPLLFCRVKRWPHIYPFPFLFLLSPILFLMRERRISALGPGM